MKIKEGFIKKDIAGMHVVVSTNAVSSFDGIITLNDTASYMFDILKNECSKEELLNKLLDEYDIDEATASADIDKFISKLTEAQLLD